MTVLSSPAVAPVSCSSKPGTSRPEPSSIIWSRPSPPANGSPRACPCSPSRRSRPRRPRARRSRAGRRARAAARPRPRPPRRRSRARACRPPAPCTRPAWRSGRTPISIENVSGWPWPGSSPMSSSGSPTGTIAAASIAAEYQDADRVAHRLVEHGVAADPLDHDRRGRLAGAEAGDAQVAAEQRAPPARCSSRPPRAAPRPRTRTRDSGSSVTDVETVGAAMGGPHDTVAPCAPGSRPGSSPARSVTSGPASPTGPSCSRAGSGRACAGRSGSCRGADRAHQPVTSKGSFWPAA